MATTGKVSTDGWRGAPGWFRWGVAGATLLGLLTRGWFLRSHSVPSEPGFLVNFDPIFYHRQARAVADGRGFIAPYLDGTHPSAGHPPLLVVVLAVASAVGLESFGAHRFVTVLIGAAVVPALGLLGARVGGWRVGVAAAVIGALYPNLWANDGLVMPEGLYTLVLVLLLVVAVDAWWSPTWWRAGLLGVGVGLAALTRGEGLLLALFVVVPIALWSRAFLDGRSRFRFLVVGGVATVLTLAPWTLYNLSRFEHPVVVSTAADTTFAGANCDGAYNGDGLGFWDPTCFQGVTPGIEESQYAVDIRADALDYVRAHVEDLPRVTAARVGRVWEVFRPVDNVTANQLQNRPRGVGWAGLVTFVLIAAAAVVGAWRMRRWPTAPLLLLFLGLPVMVTLTAALFYGNVRFRLPAEVAFVVLAAVGLFGRDPSRPSPASTATPASTAIETSAGTRNLTMP
jgi:4-amino-4-deoxy-L-arabinose transferase-like glycosyltransferase